jgi:hypothetical protein
MQKQNLSVLRQRLLALHNPTSEELAPVLSDRPMVKGTVYTLRRKCSKPSCRCATGQRHETTVLTARIDGKMRLWQVPENRLEELQDRTETYRQFRKARARLVKEHRKRQREILRVIDAIAKARTRQP